MADLKLEQATAILEAAAAHGRKLGTKPLTIAVLDAGGHLKALWREDGASNLRPEVAKAKAATALNIGQSSRKVAEDAQARPAFVGALGALAGGNVVPAAGGVRMLSRNGDVVGAIGVTGDTSDRDEDCAITGIEAAELKADS